MGVQKGIGHEIGITREAKINDYIRLSRRKVMPETCPNLPEARTCMGPAIGNTCAVNVNDRGL